MKKILLVTERRADYSRFKEILKEINNHASLKYVLVVTGIHLENSYGKTINEIIKDGFKVSYKFKMFDKRYIKKDDIGGMSRALARCFKNLTKIIEIEKPNFILSGFDIAANFSLTTIGAHMNIPVGHIQGGEVSGNIDESLRHAMSKFSHIHFVSNTDAQKRLIKMGEQKKSIYKVGCPSIDALINTKDRSNYYMKTKYNLNLKEKYILVIQHPVTSEKKLIKKHIDNIFKALKNFKYKIFFILPNNDYGAKTIVNKIKVSKMLYASHLELADYKTLLKNCEIILGNSSSGIHEAATFKKPAVNIGSRQQGRFKGKNVIDVGNYRNEIEKGIKKAFSKDFNKKLKNIINPYGAGGSSKKIVKIIKNLKLHEIKIQKQNSY
tara:strand:- start:1249 stop:2391 length:1143 start_codon:yes stop_codon:yes gene_type:complete